MCDIPFIIDSVGENIHLPNRLLYLSSGSIEENKDNGSKPSQERPAILKQKLKRYHEKETKFIPGKLSNQLREALGLGFKDIPNHIYRMRHLGYPPGWLKKAEVVSQNISITGANAVVNKSNDTSVKYDVANLYEYPGFNTYKNYDHRYDYGQQFGYMSMQSDRLLDNVATYLSEQHLLGKIATDIKDIRSTNLMYKETDFNLPITTAMTSKRVRPENKRRRKSSSMELSDVEVDEEELEALANDSASEECGKEKIVERKVEDGTCLMVQSVAKPTLISFSEGINEYRFHENLPNAGGSYKKVLGVLRRFAN